ncbi:putative mitochondrial protein [Cucumis melo var. makuwa]|uniref:Mitochondrial protein n=1 Tax=Cucumis melo var. makuwa TaxID=1194695 RepID=A0A5A7SX90_CUCMM|nr:putative mitochondrial protein [Cucumis melo var. makuwa]
MTTPPNVKMLNTLTEKIGECCTNRVLELLHMDLMGPMQAERLGDVPSQKDIDVTPTASGVNSNSENINPSASTTKTSLRDNAPSSHGQKNHPSSSIIGDLNTAITTSKKDRMDYAKLIANICYTSPTEPTSVNEALKDEFWINAMQDGTLTIQKK